MSIDLKKQPTSWVHAANHTLFDLELALLNQLTILLFINVAVDFQVLYIYMGYIRFNVQGNMCLKFYPPVWVG